MTDHSAVTETITNRLLSDGVVVSSRPDGNRLFITTSDHLKMPRPATGIGILTAMEGGGCFYWTCDRDVNPFRLLSKGFDMETAATLSDVLNEVYERMKELGPDIDPED